MGTILDFLFGRRPKIFDQDGTVRHNLPKEKWDQWDNRYQQGAEYNWRNHTGTKATQEAPRTSTPNK
jgi:hypothetical protein